jgi:hemerythrin
MAFFDWKQEYSVGIAAVDEQHKRILQLINELVEAIRDAREDLIIDAVLDDLVDYSKKHFSLEAGVFKKYRYVDEAAHAKEHEHFIGKLQGLVRAAGEGRSCVPQETLDYLRDWFANHMLKTDMAYARSFREAGLLERVAAELASPALIPPAR